MCCVFCKKSKQKRLQTKIQTSNESRKICSAQTSGNSDRCSKKQVLGLVCAAAQELGQHLQELAYRVRLLEYEKRDTEEAVEMLCRATNAALEAGRFGVGDVHNVDMHMLPMAY